MPYYADTPAKQGPPKPVWVALRQVDGHQQGHGCDKDKSVDLEPAVPFGPALIRHDVLFSDEDEMTSFSLSPGFGAAVPLVTA